MVATGIAFAFTSDYAVLPGTINPSSGSASIFVPMEHAALTAASSDLDRTKTFARYSLAGSLAGACGALISGAPEVLAPYGLSKIAVLKAMFFLYALVGLVITVLYLRLPQEPAHEQVASAPSVLGPSRRIIPPRAGSAETKWKRANWVHLFSCLDYGASQ